MRPPLTPMSGWPWAQLRAREKLDLLSPVESKPNPKGRIELATELAQPRAADAKSRSDGWKLAGDNVPGKPSHA